ncbi:Mov34/MPN/PAD-1 family protein [Luteibacter sp. 621]|jgi:proteasome lid subunit RPN8/RPN11|uniref:Mov34/MPN/PAD-1 family protein n=1 Tax=Luteibacter sp. 621 TaxID=3373916 RepID=UPI003D1C00A2
MTCDAVAWTWQWPDLLNTQLLVLDSVAQLLCKNRQTGAKRERGGLLFVSLDDPRGVVLARATPPHVRDKSARYSLDLDPGRCEAEIRSANCVGLRLIGHWHTHPEDVPAPSMQDIHSFRAFGERHRTLVEWPLAVIVGLSAFPNGVRAWSIRPDRILMAHSLEAALETRPTV